jgi:hypothetical protein
MYPDTPLPPEEPAGQNPPDGAIIDYYLKEKAKDTVILEILDSKENVIRRFTSEDKPYHVGEVNIPLQWIRPQQILSAEAGSHRFLWDMHYTPLEAPPSYPISAIYFQTVPEPTSPWVMPGTYIVKLKVGGAIYTHPLTIKMDPRVRTSMEDLKTQHDLSLTCYQSRQQVLAALKKISHLREEINERLVSPKGNLATQFKTVAQQLAQMESSPRGTATPTLGRLSDTLGSLVSLFQEADMPPTTQGVAAVSETQIQFLKVMKDWKIFQEKDLKNLNKQLRQARLPELY